MTLKPYRNDLIKGAMAANDITTKKLSEITGLSTDTLTRIRNGEVNITLTNLIAVAGVLNLSMQEIFTPRQEVEEAVLATG
ncbi:MAG: Cro/C1-type DNA-binding domain [Pyrinomonadaceae bacterium]|nr:Cro/C1-type DNA-binding domain [Pyrinomonadaceae bacterium]